MRSPGAATSTVGLRLAKLASFIAWVLAVTERNPLRSKAAGYSWAAVSLPAPAKIAASMISSGLDDLRAHQWRLP
jgi:hypothetical protein